MQAYLASSSSDEDAQQQDPSKYQALLSQAAGQQRAGGKAWGAADESAAESDADSGADAAAKLQPQVRQAAWLGLSSLCSWGRIIFFFRPATVTSRVTQKQPLCSTVGKAARRLVLEQHSRKYVTCMCLCAGADLRAADGCG